MGHRQIGHGGAVYGCATQLESLPDEQLGVAAAAALDCANGTVEKLCEYALRLMLASRAGQPLPEYASTTDVPPERATSLVGTYRCDDQLVEVDYINTQLTLKHKAATHQLRQLQSSGELVGGRCAREWLEGRSAWRRSPSHRRSTVHAFA